MSRYVIWTDDENMEVFVGFEEGLGAFFLTIEDPRTCTGEAGTYSFHNYDHHPGKGMTLMEVATALEKFALTLPSDLAKQLMEDARSSEASIAEDVVSTIIEPAPPTNHVLGWQSAM